MMTRGKEIVVMRIATRLLGLVLLSLVLGLTACDTFSGSDEIADLETQSAQMQGTIQMMGTPQLTIAALEQAATQNVIFRAQLTESAINLLEAQSTLTVIELTGGNPGVTGSNAAAPAVAAPAPTTVPAVPPGDQTPTNLTPSPSPAQQITNFTGTVVGTGVDADDCATGIAARFETTLNQIYVDTRINYLPAGSQIGARWFVNGELFFDDVQCWIPNEEYRDICAWCSIVPDGAVFPTGIWTVEFYLNNQLMSQTRFELVEAMDDGGSATQ
jgi:hypothetical protein